MARHTAKSHKIRKVEILVIQILIYKNGVNWIQHIDRSSTFTDMALPVGDSKIGFVADDGDTNMSVFIYFNKLYTGL